MIHFKTDWSDLLDMTTSPMDYQAFASEIDIFPILPDNQLAKEIKKRSFFSIDFFFYNKWILETTMYAHRAQRTKPEA